MRLPLWRHRREDELEEELHSHLQMAARERIERGETPEQAETRARREFGNLSLVKEATRAIWGWIWLEQLGQDVRYAIRMLRRSPGFTTVAVSSLALGIGANTAIFNAINALMLRTLPVRNPQELVMFFESAPDTPSPVPIGTSYQWVQKYNDLTQVFSAVSGVCLTDRFNVITNSVGGDSGPVAVSLVSGNYFPMLGVSAMVGRTLDPSDDRVPGGHLVAAFRSGQVVGDFPGGNLSGPAHWRRVIRADAKKSERTGSRY